MPISSSGKCTAKGNYFESKTTSAHKSICAVPPVPNERSSRQNKKLKDICSKKKVSVKRQRHPLKLLYSSNVESYMSTDTECSKNQKSGSLYRLKEHLAQATNRSSFLRGNDKTHKIKNTSVDLKVKQESSAYVTKENNYDVLNQYERKWSNYIAERRKEIINQYDSKQSQEIISHVLTKSVSSNFKTLNKTTCSANTLKKPRGKHCNVFKVMMQSMSRKLKLKNSGHNVKKTNDVIVLHVPKKFSYTSVEATTTRRFITPTSTVAAVPAPKEKKKKLKEKPMKFPPLKIKDSLSEKMIYINRLTKPPDKLCGRGEIFVHNRT